MASSQDLRPVSRYKAYIHDKQQDETHRQGRLKSNFAFQTTLCRKLILQIQCCLPVSRHRLLHFVTLTFALGTF